ncbi:hypothetical protein KYB31_09370 [Clostridium felsineum]|nr:hypothetical protein [Clostridium felsineum]MCR3759198.1 hypothetical protein [Clostridium felsineum]
MKYYANILNGCTYKTSSLVWQKRFFERASYMEISKETYEGLGDIF